MRTKLFEASSLVTVLQERKAATMKDLKTALGTQVDMTVFQGREVYRRR